MNENEKSYLLMKNPYSAAYMLLLVKARELGCDPSGKKALEAVVELVGEDNREYVASSSGRMNVCNIDDLSERIKRDALDIINRS